MRTKLKKMLLCMTALTLMTASGTAFAAEEETQKETAAAEEVTASAMAREAVEKVTAEAPDIKKFLEKKGSINGYDVYYKAKDFGTAIWEANGGKPEKKSEYTEKQTELDKAIKSLSQLGELTLIGRDGTPAASFKSGTKTDNGKLYVSDAGRFLLTVNEDTLRPTKLMEVISTIDDPCIYISADGKILEQTDTKHKKITASYKDKGIKDGKRIFEGENGFVWTNEETSQVYGAFRYSAHNESYRLIVSDRFGSFGIENLESGYIWWSSPLEASRDSIAAPLLADELRSSNILRYGIPESRNNSNFLRSASTDCEISVKDIKNGIRVTYNYHSAGFSFPVDYTLESDFVKASLKVKDIKESRPENIATEVTLLGSFGAASSSESGYFVVPDGCGALIRFNNKKSSKKDLYRQRVYGADAAAVPAVNGAVTEHIDFPVYGIVKEDNAMLVVAAGGDTNAYLSANVSGQSNTNYNLCGFTFVLRDTDSFYVSGGSSERFTVFEKGDIRSDDIELRYYPISAKGADYCDIAARYRQYLLEEENVSIKAKENDSPLYLGLYGGAVKKKSFLGIPLNMTSSVTSFAQAGDIVSKLRNSGTDDIAVSYKNWTYDGIKNKIDTSASPSGKLGGNGGFADFSALVSQQGSLYPVSDDRCFLSGNGYNTFSGASVRISGAYSRIRSYDLAYGVPDTTKKNKSLLSPSCFGNVLSELAENYSSAGITGISLDDLTTVLYGDYGKNSYSRAMTADILAEGCAALESTLENGILAERANAYLLPYISRIRNAPLSSGNFDIFDEDIPFYQLVLHGVIPYSCEAVNSKPSPEEYVLKAVAAGCSLNFDMTGTEPSELKDTEFDNLYYADSRWWNDTAAEMYRLVSPLLKETSGSFITDYSENGSIITTVYSNGTSVQTDLEKQTIEYNGTVIDLGKGEIR